MTENELITAINLILGETVDSTLLSAYINQARRECINWEYHLLEPTADEIASVNITKYDSLIVDAIVFGYSIRGAEGETQHSENGILRGFKYSDMRSYIESHLVPYAKAL